jgi:hypothetical protein
MMETKSSTISPTEYQAIIQACRLLPKPQGNYHVEDFVENLLLTVLDYQMQGAVVANAVRHFRRHHGSTLQNYDALRRFLAEHADDTDAALQLWGYRYSKRLGQLRRLVEYFGSLPDPVTDQTALRRWAGRPDSADFGGKIKGLKRAIYKWLVMRVGVDTVKPDTHVKRWLQMVAGRSFSDDETVYVLEKAARECGRKAYELDWSIWEHQRGRPEIV